MTCKKIRRKSRSVCIGDMNTLIKLQNRNITPPLFGDPDFDEEFTDVAEVWAMVNTVSGKTVFDGVNTDINVTHEIYIYYDATVTAETWVELNGKRLDIVPNGVENLEERDEFLKLTCTERGANTIEATKT